MTSRVVTPQEIPYQQDRRSGAARIGSPGFEYKSIVQT
jgi:hypothetical protein